MSIILPTFNEMKLGILPRLLAAIQGLPTCEVIAVDGGSSDETVSVLESYHASIIIHQCNTRAERINVGLQKAQGEMILLHHPRSILDRKGVEFLLEHAQDLTWGAFTHRFDREHPLLRFTSWYSNYVRGRNSGIFYLDHCLFFERKLMCKIPEVPIFEDTLLCELLRKIAEPELLPFFSTTSAIRFTSNGIWKQSLYNQWLKLAYRFGLQSLETMNRHYEKDLELNSSY